MSKFKKLAAVLLSAVMLVCSFSVQASADSIEDTAKSIASGTSYSAQLYNNTTADYKIKSTKSGTLKISLTSKSETIRVYIYDSDGNELQLSDKSVSSGNAEYSSYSKCTRCEWKDTVEKFAGTLSYSIKKGTYYIRFERLYSSGNGKLSFKATFPTSSDSSSSTSSGKSEVWRMCIHLSVGDKLSLDGWGIFYTDENYTMNYSSSNTSVATINKNGVVTAKKKGNTTITLKVNNTSAQVEIVVN